MAEVERRVCEDRISSLSDDLLVQILLLVPTKDAVATTFLSKRWRFVWRMLPRLEYRETETSDGNINSVWWFLEDSFRLHKAPLLERLCIELGPQCPIYVNPVKWVAKALDTRVRWLIFRLLWKGEPIRMPKSLYFCKTLERLTLSYKILVDVPRQVSLPSLTELDLFCVVYKDEDSHVRLLSSCPVLKCLKVTRNRHVEDNVRTFSVKVPSLLRLDYKADTTFQDSDDRFLVIDTPNLLSLHIFDIFGHSFSVEYMPHLVTVVIDVLFPNENFMRSLSSVKYLALSPFDIMVPWCDAVNNYSRLVECMIFLSDQDLCESLLVLLSNCSKLKVFMVDSEIGQYANRGPGLWNQPSSVPRCLSSHLEIFEWEGYAGREYEKELIRYILENSKCLKTAGISPNSTCSEEKQKMVIELESMQRVPTSVLLSSARMLFRR
ncbi:FBD domain [Arabidopsis suecica]|uniref:FBD domain n=1 Tax=Arabidopsis suecica TaxID=45249 RepID=A0A8T1ZZR2_ARASU|nr:FBD domain [Arabidopsis suecica]